jgi:hypothetical protein
LRGDAALFHENLCRQSFKQYPVQGAHGAGIDAERAILKGGTLSNGQVEIQFRESHGAVLRELISMFGYKPKEIVTCYGGFLGEAPPKDEDHNHMRHIPTTNYVLDGEEFSGCFPFEYGGVFTMGRTVAMTPRCDDKAWEEVISGNGIGYMANTATKCPLQHRSRTNVTVHTAILGRRIPGVPYSSVVYLRAGANGIQPREPIISPYEGCQNNKKFRFVCSDAQHYESAGRVYVPVEDVASGDDASYEAR